VALSARRIVVGLLVALTILALVFNTWIGAQGRAFIVLSTTIETPGVTWIVRALTREPSAREQVVAGAPTTVVTPGGDGPWPTVVFANGATRVGRRHSDVQRLARGLARAGFLVFVPDLPGLPLGEITPRTVESLVRVADAAARSGDSRGDRVGFTGVSVGTSLALLAAEDDLLHGRVRAVVGIAPYARLRAVTKLATTGSGPTGPYAVDPYLGLAVARSLVAGLPPAAEPTRLLRALEAVDDDDPSPLRLLERWRSPEGDVRDVIALLLNQDPARFDALYARLPASLRRDVRRLSPLARADRIDAPVELASDRTDIYFPLAESRALVRALPDGRLAPTTTLGHAIPHPAARDLRDLLAFNGWVVRSLRALR
jgi:pimeloyl-ACP methyl ester carboxylesterase